jgi:C4-dicarboxylate-specific signal transduction histidine kinase
MVDLLQIEQVMLNLLKNSTEAIREAGSDGGVITMTATQRSPHLVAITIDDTGPGFSAAALDGGSAFSTSKKAEGLGIGLALCRSIVESHGGELRITNKDTGASATFTLPVAGRD